MLKPDEQIKPKFCIMPLNGLQIFSARSVVWQDLKQIIHIMPAVPRKHTCVRYIELNAYYLLNPQPGRQPSIRFDIGIYDKGMCCKSLERCAFNIQSGKCRDPFISEYIGKNFWPNKYNQKTK